MCKSVCQRRLGSVNLCRRLFLGASGALFRGSSEREAHSTRAHEQDRRGVSPSRMCEGKPRHLPRPNQQTATQITDQSVWAMGSNVGTCFGHHHIYCSPAGS